MNLADAVIGAGAALALHQLWRVGRVLLARALDGRLGWW